jgi:hypothetical protein
MEYMIIAAIIINCIFCSIRGVFRRILPDMPFAGEIFVLVGIEVRCWFSLSIVFLWIYFVCLAFVDTIVQDYTIEH